MRLGTVESVALDAPLASAIKLAFERLRDAGTSEAALNFDASWHPTMDVVELIADELSTTDDIERLTLIHPSAAMSVIAAGVSSRAPTVTITSQRSIYDEPEDEHTDATASKTIFRMDRNESLEAFVRASVREARSRAVRRFALIFHHDTRPTMALADTLVEELLQSGVREIGLIHPAVDLNAIAASMRLRIPNLNIALGRIRSATPPVKT